MRNAREGSPNFFARMFQVGQLGVEDKDYVRQRKQKLLDIDGTLRDRAAAFPPRPMLFPMNINTGFFQSGQRYRKLDKLFTPEITITAETSCVTAIAFNLGATGQTPAEIIWRSDLAQSLDLERDNYPPSLFGNGRVNPSQNLVDAFPMANGYPITHASSGYDANNPYQYRDPRLTKYIVVNESQQGPAADVIITGTYGTNNDALNQEKGFSTRTGYYLRKLLRSDVNPNPAFNTTQKHYTARIRYTEIFLAYAEAANEAWGSRHRWRRLSRIGKE